MAHDNYWSKSTIILQWASYLGIDLEGFHHQCIVVDGGKDLLILAPIKFNRPNLRSFMEFEAAAIS